MTGSDAILIVGKQLYQNFSIDQEQIREPYKSVYENFSNQEKKQGVSLIGNVGAGKTAMMRIMQKLFINTPRKFKWVGAKEFKYLLESYSAVEVMEMYGKTCAMDLYIDDIGLGGGDYKKYGNAINIISEIIFDRYELFVESGFKTHVSSNIPTTVDKEKYPEADTLEKFYGARVTDRLKEMCHTIKIVGKSLRGGSNG